MPQRHHDTSDLHFPLVAISKVGWVNWAGSSSEFPSAVPWDTLEDWQGMEIYDAEGLYFLVTRAFRQYPKSRWGYWLFRLIGESIGVGLELTPPTKISAEELQRRLVALGNAHLSYAGVSSHRELLECM